MVTATAATQGTPRRRDVAVLALVTPDGRFLLQHRDASAPAYPNVWGFFGGGIKEGETPEAAMRREIREELSLEITEAERLHAWEYEIPELRRFGTIHLFIAPFPGFDALEQREGDGFALATPEEALAVQNIRADHPGFRTLQEHFRR